MSVPTSSHRKIRFGKFELNLQTTELTSNGRKMTLQHQPFHVLAMLLERPGQLVTREELKNKLWASDTFVDFDRGLNKAVNRLREVLGDSVDQPQYIETLPRLGYRFIAQIEVPPTSDGDTNVRGAWRKFTAWTVVGAACVFAAVIAYRRISPGVDPPDMTPVPFTAYLGREVCPTFSPDGSQILSRGTVILSQGRRASIYM